MHAISSNWKLGLSLSLITAIFWGLLPIALSNLLYYTDAITVTWSRFLIAAIVLGSFLIAKRKLPNPRLLKQQVILTLSTIVILGLASNYILYMLGLSFTNPSSAQIMIQVGPVGLLCGSLILFKETFNVKQQLGLAAFIVGLLLFFNQRIPDLFVIQDRYNLGLLSLFFAGACWAIYALAQKQLLKYYTSEQIMLMIYLFGSCIFFPFATLNTIYSLDIIGWLLLLFCGANTLIAYGAFAEALNHWEASKISTILALTPLLTLIFMHITNYFSSGYIVIEPINSLSLLGAALVITGSATIALK